MYIVNDIAYAETSIEMMKVKEVKTIDVYYKVASECRIEVSETKLTPSKHCNGFFSTKRFDRDDIMAAEFTHITDGMQHQSTGTTP